MIIGSEFRPLWSVWAIDSSSFLELRLARVQSARIVAAPDLRLKCYRAD